MDIKETYQQNSNDQAKETNSAAKDLNNQNLDEEHRVGRIRESSSRSNLHQPISFKILLERKNLR